MLFYHGYRAAKMNPGRMGARPVFRPGARRFLFVFVYN